MLHLLLYWKKYVMFKTLIWYMSEYVMKLDRFTFLVLYFFSVCTLCVYLYMLDFCIVQFSFLTLFWCTVLFFSHLTSHQTQCILNILAGILYPYVKWYIYFFVDLHVCVLFWCILRLWCLKAVISVKPVSYNYNILILWSTEPGTNAQYSQSEFNIAKY